MFGWMEVWMFVPQPRSDYCINSDENRIKILFLSWKFNKFKEKGKEAEKTGFEEHLPNCYVNGFFSMFLIKFYLFKHTFYSYKKYKSNIFHVQRPYTIRFRLFS